MNSECFSFDKVNELFKQGPVIQVGKNTIRTVTEDCKSYMGKYFFLTNVGNYYFWEAGSQDFFVHSKESIKEVYLNRLPSEVSFWFFKENTAIFSVVNEVNKPRLFDNKINMFYGFKYPSMKKYGEYSEETQDKVNLYLSYIKEVLCSYNEDSYQYIVKWLANMCQGNKNDSCLYLKGPEGIGKSTLSDFMMSWVLGDNITVKSRAEPLRTPYNKILCGKLLVVFEELPNFGEREWEGISSTLKDYITGFDTLYADKYEKQFKARNINNYIINSNVDAIKHSDGRRYVILDLSTKRKGDHKYFGNIKSQCYNAEVGEAFLSYMLEIDVKGFNGQKDMPVTQNKRNAIAERLHMEYKFIKEQYVFTKTSIKCTARKLYDEYVEYCKLSDYKPLTYIKFTTKLSEVNIEFKKSHGIYKYSMSYDELKQLADKNQWIHDLDEFNPKSIESFDVEEDDPKDIIIADLKKEVERLKALLTGPKKPVEEPVKPVKTITPKPKKTKAVKPDTSMVTVLDLFD